ncbi:MAG: T9SS type A sorting domain-containing protein [Saprospiraceae bacterium]|nr:T9SS type A sorting domain-containing protein [Saprospiraceae bacterium]
MRTILTALALTFSILLVAQDQVGDDLLGMTANEQWGYSTAISDEGKLLVIGAPFRGPSQGALTVYAQTIGSWSFQWGLNGIEGGTTAFSVDISDDGDRIALGSPTTVQGQVNVFSKGGIAYSPLGPGITGPEDLGTLFGVEVSLSGDGKRLAVGARSFDDDGVDVGYVGFFEYDGTEWIEYTEPFVGTVEHAQKGHSIDLSYDGSIIAIGSPFSFNQMNTGMVEVYALDNDMWEPMGEPILGAEDLTGNDVALSADGQRLAIGRPGSDVVSVYAFENGDWEKMADLNISSSSTSGWSTDISADGNRVIVGALGLNISSIPGAVQIFDFNGSSWEAKGDPVMGLVAEAFGWNVSLSPCGTHFSVGIPGSDGSANDEGRVEVYSIDPVTTSILAFTDQDMEIYPNPASDLLQLRGQDFNQSRPVRIVDPLGRIVLDTYSRGGNLDISSLRPGMYQVLIPYQEMHHVVRALVKIK